MVEELRCWQCSAPLIRKPGPGRKPRYCNDRCRRLHNPVKYERHPLAPDKRSELARNAAIARWNAVAKADRSAVMSTVALARYPGPRRVKRTRMERVCRFCGCSALMTVTQQSCGSPACKLARHAERNRKYASARRAILRGVESEVFEPRVVFDRDGWICQLCGDPVDEKLRWPHPMSVSLDHVVPLSRGGAHIPSNTQCAHLVCNIRRGNRFSPLVGA